MQRQNLSCPNSSSIPCVDPGWHDRLHSPGHLHGCNADWAYHPDIRPGPVPLCAGHHTHRHRRPPLHHTGASESFHSPGLSKGSSGASAVRHNPSELCKEHVCLHLMLREQDTALCATFWCVNDSLRSSLQHVCSKAGSAPVTAQVWSYFLPAWNNIIQANTEAGTGVLYSGTTREVYQPNRGGAGICQSPCTSSGSRHSVAIWRASHSRANASHAHLLASPHA